MILRDNIKLINDLYMGKREKPTIIVLDSNGKEVLNASLPFASMYIGHFKFADCTVYGGNNFGGKLTFNIVYEDGQTE